MTRRSNILIQIGLALGVIVLVVFSVYSFWGTTPAHWGALIGAWPYHWREAGLAFLLSVAGVTVDWVAWNCAWRGQGVRMPAKISAPVFLSGFAVQLIPLQFCRAIRVYLTFRNGIATLRQGLTAELISLVMDITAAGSLLVAFLTPFPYKTGAIVLALIAGPIVLLVGDQSRPFVARWFKHLTAQPFFSWQNSVAYYGRVADWTMLTLVLLTISNVTMPGTTWQTCGAATLGASITGAASSVPGGLGVNETFISVAIGATQENALLAERGVTVFLFRLFSFWMWMPIGWWSLWFFRRHAARDNALRA